MKPLCIDLFCGLGGWAEGFLAEDYEVVGFDIERHDYGSGGYPGRLVLRDVLTLHGSQFRDAAVIVASPPCQAYSYRAMPWRRAKTLPPPSNDLFDACFRIQKEATEAAGHYIPLVVENVRGAQKWVGRARWHFGSFYLWGDVPALMPTAGQFKNDSAQRGGTWFGIAHGRQQMPDHPARGDGEPGIKQSGSGAIWFNVGIALLPSSSARRKAASAQIAKIPFSLARWIAQVYNPSPAPQLQGGAKTKQLP